MGIPPLRVAFVKSYIKNILVHGLSYLDTMTKIFEGGKIINPLTSQLINFSGKNKIKSQARKLINLELKLKFKEINFSRWKNWWV